MPNLLHSTFLVQVYRDVKLPEIRCLDAYLRIGCTQLTDPRHDHDMAEFLLSHMRQCSLDNIDRAEKVGLELTAYQIQCLL